SDPLLEAMPVIPTDRMQANQVQAASEIQELIAQALQHRPELAETDVDLLNRQISRKAARNALLPSLSLVGFSGGSGLAGPLHPLCQGCTSSGPVDFAGALGNTL